MNDQEIPDELPDLPVTSESIPVEEDVDDFSKIEIEAKIRELENELKKDEEDPIPDEIDIFKGAKEHYDKTWENLLDLSEVDDIEIEDPIHSNKKINIHVLIQGIKKDYLDYKDYKRASHHALLGLQSFLRHTREISHAIERVQYAEKIMVEMMGEQLINTRIENERQKRLLYQSIPTIKEAFKNMNAKIITHNTAIIQSDEELSAQQKSLDFQDRLNDFLQMTWDQFQDQGCDEEEWDSRIEFYKDKFESLMKTKVASPGLFVPNFKRANKNPWDLPCVIFAVKELKEKLIERFDEIKFTKLFEGLVFLTLNP